MAKLSPIVSEFETTEQAEAYDRWFREEVRQSIAEGGAIPHDQVMAEMDEIIERTRASSRLGE